MAREWLINQAKLVTSLLYQQHPVLAHKAVQGVHRFLDMWPYADQMFLLDAYRYSRVEAGRNWKHGYQGS